MQKATAIFYGLSISVLMTALFVMQPSKVPGVAAMQTGIEQQFSIAWQQIIGDGPYFDELAFVFDSITAFYDQATNETVVMLSAPDTDEAIYYVFHTTYENIAQIFHPKQAYSAQNVDLTDYDNFMSEQAINNIVPDTIKTLTGTVAGEETFRYAEPVNNENSWVTIQDNFTGQIYCLAIYNGEVNKYLGHCKSEYH